MRRRDTLRRHRELGRTSPTAKCFPGMTVCGEGERVRTFRVSVEVTAGEEPNWLGLGTAG